MGNKAYEQQGLFGSIVDDVVIFIISKGFIKGCWVEYGPQQPVRPSKRFEKTEIC